MPRLPHQSIASDLETPTVTRQNSQRHRADNFHSSFFGVLSAANTGENDPLAFAGRFSDFKKSCPARVIISSPEKGEYSRKLVALPNSLQELYDLGARKFDIAHAKVLTKGVEIEDFDVIRDCDELISVRSGNKDNDFEAKI